MSTTFVRAQLDLLKGFDQVNFLNKGKGIVIRLSDVLKYSNPIKIKNAEITFNESEKIEKEYYNLDISDFVIGYKQQDEKVDNPGYKIDGVTLFTGDDLVKINVNGNCFVSQVNNYYNKKSRGKNKIISLTYATAELSSNWAYNIDDIVNKTNQEMSHPRVMFVNLKNFEKK